MSDQDLLTRLQGKLDELCSLKIVFEDMKQPVPDIILHRIRAVSDQMGLPHE